MPARSSLWESFERAEGHIVVPGKLVAVPGQPAAVLEKPVLELEGRLAVLEVDTVGNAVIEADELQMTEQHFLVAYFALASVHGLCTPV